jgi:hypothetical protein
VLAPRLTPPSRELSYRKPALSGLCNRRKCGAEYRGASAPTSTSCIERQKDAVEMADVCRNAECRIIDAQRSILLRKDLGALLVDIKDAIGYKTFCVTAVIK